MTFSVKIWWLSLPGEVMQMSVPTLLVFRSNAGVKSTSPVTENHYKNGYENCTTST